MVSTSNFFKTTDTAVHPILTPVEPSLDTRISTAREHARRLTALYGVTSPDVAVAWEEVEELLSVKAKQREQKVTAFEEYCSLYPDAPECRIYDV
ncbi:MAG: Calvin cycle protein CP12 [Thainema sp.]